MMDSLIAVFLLVPKSAIFEGFTISISNAKPRFVVHFTTLKYIVRWIYLMINDGFFDNKVAASQ